MYHVFHVILYNYYMLWISLVLNERVGSYVPSVAHEP